MEIHLKDPLPSLPIYLDVGILPKHLLKEENIEESQFNYRPVGTGPFKLQRWSKNQIVLKANSNYFATEPNLNKIIVKVFKDQNIVWAELMSGNVDFVFPPYSRNYDIIVKIPDFKVYSFLNPYYYISAFNEANIYFKHQKTRQALNYAINKEKILRKVLYGKGRISSGTVYPLSWAYNGEINPYPYKPRKALELLKEANWQDTNRNHILDKEGREFEFVLLIVKGDDVSWTCAMLMQQQLLEVGIRMIVKPLPFSIIYEKFLLTKKFDAALLNIISDDPDKNYAWWHSSQIDHGFNVFSYRNKKIDELLDRGRTTLEMKERRKIYRQLQREIHDDPPGVFLFWRDYLIGIHKRFRGVKVSPAGILNNIHEWYVPKEEQKYR